MNPLDVVRSLYTAIEAGKSGAALAHLFTDDVVTVERPNRIKPNGAVSDAATMAKNSIAGAGLLAEQKYEIENIFAHAETVVVRLKWTGTIAKDIGPFKGGQTLTAYIAQFIDVIGDKVSRIETYDCYEPF